MTIGRPIQRDWDTIKFGFPLFKMWGERLKDHKVLTTTNEVRKQLDGGSVDSVSSCT